MHSLRPRSVTIAIPTWNRLPFLQRTLESALSQTYQDLQIVVSDDGSTDGTWEYLSQISDPRLTRIRKPSNDGLFANFSTCLRASTSEFFLLLNDDDLLLPTAIEKLVSAFLHPPNNVHTSAIGIAWLPFILVDGQNRALWNIHSGPPIERTVKLIEGLCRGRRGPICSGIMLRTADSLAAGGYELRFGEICDVANWGKASLLREFAVCIDEPLMQYRVHGSGGSATSRTECAPWQNAIRQMIREFSEIVRARGDEEGASSLLRCCNPSLANITASVLMRQIGQPGWIGKAIREVWRSRNFMFTPFVFRRLIRDGHKLLRLALGNLQFTNSEHQIS
jgi:hypothetical protein